MQTRRKFLSRAAGTVISLGAGGIVLRALGQENDNPSRGMITAEAQDAIDQGLAFLARNQNQNNGSFGTNQHTGSVAITGLAGLAFMAAGNQPSRRPYGREGTPALPYLLRPEERRQVPG